MKLLILYMLGLATVTSVLADYALIDLCDDSTCYEHSDLCAVPSVRNEGVLVSMNENNKQCLCYCGKGDGEQCIGDGECAVGFACASNFDEKTLEQINGTSAQHPGICYNMCEIKMQRRGKTEGCKPFETCSIDENGADCHRVRVRCKNPMPEDTQCKGMLKMPNGERHVETFGSPCELHMRNYDIEQLSRDGPFFEITDYYN